MIVSLIDLEIILNRSEMDFSSNSRWQNRKERSNRSTNNGGMAKRAKLPVRDG